MKISLTRIGNPFNFEASDADGNTIKLDGDPSVGGSGNGVRPMQALLMGLGGCAGIDVVMILEKMKQQVTDIKMEITGERQAIEGGDAKVWKDIHIKFMLAGNLDPAKIKRAISLSMDKYCSVAQMLNKTATITWDFEIA